MVPADLLFDNDAFAARAERVGGARHGGDVISELNAEQREKLPAKAFGLPEKARTKEAKKESGNYPMPDKKRARNAKSRAAQQEEAGNLTKDERDRIVRKANRSSTTDERQRPPADGNTRRRQRRSRGRHGSPPAPERGADLFNRLRLGPRPAWPSRPPHDDDPRATGPAGGAYGGRQ